MDNTIELKKQAIKNWLENNEFYNVQTNDSIFMVADGISNKMVVMVETHSNIYIDITEIKIQSVNSGRQLWKADVVEEDIHWEIL